MPPLRQSIALIETIPLTDVTVLISTFPVPEPVRASLEEGNEVCAQLPKIPITRIEKEQNKRVLFIF